MPLHQRRTLKAQALYFRVLLRRFRGTFSALIILVFGGGTLLWWLYAQTGKPISWGRALLATYFLFFAQPIVEIPDHLGIALLCVIIPPLGIFTLAEGVVRFAYLFFARERDDKEWFAVLAKTLTDHVIVCGGGRVGFRVFEQLRKLGIPMVVIEKTQDSPLLAAVREAGVPVLVADVRSQQVLDEANIARAPAIVC